MYIYIYIYIILLYTVTNKTHADDRRARHERLPRRRPAALRGDEAHPRRAHGLPGHIMLSFNIYIYMHYDTLCYVMLYHIIVLYNIL